MIESIQRVIARTQQTRPMVHSITNPVTINDCANIILAAGGTAIMAQDEREVDQITAHAAALALNMGALRAQEAMMLAARTSKRLGHPVVLDPVAAGASRLRGEMCSRLLAEGLVSVVRGNASEIRALTAGQENAAGVEVDVLDRVTEQNLTESAAWLRQFSRRPATGCRYDRGRHTTRNLLRVGRAGQRDNRVIALHHAIDRLGEATVAVFRVQALADVDDYRTSRDNSCKLLRR